MTVVSLLVIKGLIDSISAKEGFDDGSRVNRVLGNDRV